MGSIRVNKAAARRLIDEGYTIKLIPCNIRLKNLYFEPMYVTKEKLDEGHLTFNQLVNEYEYYNCNTREMGYYSAYYLYMDFTLWGHDESPLTYSRAIELYKENKKEAEDFASA